MKILREEIPIFIIYAVIFAYAIAIHFFRLPLPLSSVAVPTAIVLFVIFILHVLNLFLRGNG